MRPVMTERDGPTVRPRVFQWPVRVYYEDTDSGGIVYYANYLRFFERARTEWLRSIGVSQRRLGDDEGIQFVVTRFTIDYRASARLDDLLELDMDIIAARRASLILAQRACIEGSAQPLATARTIIAALSCNTGRPVGMPDWLLSRVNS